MALDSPSTLLYSQAAVLLQDLQNSSSAGLLKTGHDLSIQIANILTKFQDSAGHPLFEYYPVEDGEPPLSAKMNLLWTMLRHDVSLLQQETDILRAGSLMSFNNIQVEIQKAAEQNRRLLNQVKALQLYSDSIDSNIITFGDEFHSGDYIDRDFNSNDQQADVVEGRFLALASLGELLNLTAKATVEVLETSNGFLGNNQEIEDPNKNTPIANSDSDPYYTYWSESNNPNRLSALVDSGPDTWIEYENYLVNEQDQKLASNFNFKYAINDSKAIGSDVDSGGRQAYINWASGPKDNVLKLDVLITLQNVAAANQIIITPFQLRNNKNAPILIKSIEISSDGSTWTTLNNANIWLGTNINLETARTASDVVVNTAVWSFDTINIKFVRFHVEQPNPVDSLIGHDYYLKKINSTQSSTTSTLTRIEGPIPPITDPTKYHAFGSLSQNDVIQKREFFQGKRWAIGIRDVVVEQRNYALTSTIVTKPLRVGGLIDRVALSAEVDVPSSFDTSDQWVSFYISPDNGLSWHQISRIQDDYLSIPEIIAFNDPTPAEFRDPAVLYVSTSNPVDRLRLKIVLRRPEDNPIASPIVRSYRLKVRKQ